jgi:hypothetical protein
MIALKELKACRHGLHQNVEALCGCTVKVYYQDNQAVCGALRKMSSKCPALMTEIKDVVPWLHENKIRLDVVYIRSEANLADVSSSKQDLDMWSSAEGKRTERFSEKSSRYRDSLKSEVRLPRD